MIKMGENINYITDYSKYIFGRANKYFGSDIKFPNSLVKRIDEIYDEFKAKDKECRKKGITPYYSVSPIFFVYGVSSINDDFLSIYNLSCYNKVKVFKKDYTHLIQFTEKNMDKIRIIHNFDRNLIDDYHKFLCKVGVKEVLHNILKKNSREYFVKEMDRFKKRIDNDLEKLSKNPNYNYEL